MSDSRPLRGLSLVLGSVDAVRNLRALSMLLFTFASAGLLLAMAESAFSRGADWLGAAELVAAALVAFYGGNAAGLLIMDQARGLRPRELADAISVSLRTAHRLLLALLMLLAGYALAFGVLIGLLWLSRSAVLGAVAGPALFGLVVPVGVLGVGLALLSLAAVVMPLTAPGVWAGRPVLALVRELLQLVRQRLLTVALLMTAVSALAAGVGALATFSVVTGGRVVAELAVRVVGVDVPAQQLMAGLFGRGLRSLGAAGAAADATGHAGAALVGGGMVFVLALLLPGLVYLGGSCAVYLAMTEDERVSRTDNPDGLATARPVTGDIRDSSAPAAPQGAPAASASAVPPASSAPTAAPPVP